MNKKRQECGVEYVVGHFSFDSGFCRQCKPGFFGFPVWLQPTTAGTKDVWRTVIVIHAILFLLFGMLLDGGIISLPGGIYCLTILACNNQEN